MWEKIQRATYVYCMVFGNHSVPLFYLLHSRTSTPKCCRLENNTARVVLSWVHNLLVLYLDREGCGLQFFSPTRKSQIRATPWSQWTAHRGIPAGREGWSGSSQKLSLWVRCVRSATSSSSGPKTDSDILEVNGIRHHLSHLMSSISRHNCGTRATDLGSLGEQPSIRKIHQPLRPDSHQRKDFSSPWTLQKMQVQTCIRFDWCQFVEWDHHLDQNGLFSQVHILPQTFQN